ncbi:MAG: hypothetical protein RL326_479 [Pseudomonadota bacterium]|jgi:hypothetical protein
MDNPFNGVSRSRKERKLIDAGIYHAVLSDVKTVQVTDKKTQEKKTKILFVYAIPGEETELTAFFNPSLADTSWIVKYLKASCGNSFTPEIQGSSDKMWAFIRGLVGKEWNLVVTQSNGYNNVQSAVPVKEKKAPAPVGPAQDVTFSFADDQIPF